LTPQQIAALRARGVRNLSAVAPALLREVLAQQAPPARERYRRSTTTENERGTDARITPTH
jgi:hypothetical protein